MSINDRIFEKINEKGFTQKEFSKLSGIPESTVSDWKRHGKVPSSDKLLKISRTLGISLYELLMDEDELETSGSLEVEQLLTDDEQNIIEIYRAVSAPSKKAIISYFEKLSNMLEDGENHTQRKSNKLSKKQECFETDAELLQKKMLTRKLRKLARLDRVKLDESEHDSKLNLHLFKYLDYVGVEKLDYIKDYLSHIQPFMLTEIRSQEKFDNAICVLDGGYRISVYIKVDATKGEEVIVSFHENNKGGIARASKRAKNLTKVYVFADNIGSHLIGSDSYTIDLFITRGIKTFPISTIAQKYDDEGFLVSLAELEREICNVANQYLEDIYTTDLDFSEVDRFSSMYELSFTSFGQDCLSNISLLIDSSLIQQTTLGRQIADAAIVIYCNSLGITEADKKELLDTLKARFAVNSSRAIPLILQRIEMNLIAEEI
ncbi:Helix-turn-helix [Pseudobutyrivibrio sp. YE44]|uniref:helix-turn-helix domain-containing protein n=1 Tax=Pseudobutyrivibrio sp. YE44 TaxID=1520802 RepID=UPI00088F7B5F|nr:helix-turn-helix domain-containing protein [Pseudobutyrivibrio sp. YE44]SDB40242.1 Helix-turn-helix [Pseudobutyrivibrio sp. YE44]